MNARFIPFLLTLSSFPCFAWERRYSPLRGLDRDAKRPNLRFPREAWEPGCFVPFLRTWAWSSFPVHRYLQPQNRNPLDEQFCQSPSRHFVASRVRLWNSLGCGSHRPSGQMRDRCRRGGARLDARRCTRIAETASKTEAALAESGNGCGWFRRRKGSTTRLSSQTAFTYALLSKRQPEVSR